MEDEQENAWLWQIYQHSVSGVKTRRIVVGICCLLCGHNTVRCAMLCREVPAETHYLHTSEDKARRMTSRYDAVPRTTVCPDFHTATAGLSTRPQFSALRTCRLCVAQRPFCGRLVAMQQHIADINILLQPEIMNLVNTSVKTCFPEQQPPSSNSSDCSSGSLQEWAVDKAACATYLYYM